MMQGTETSASRTVFPLGYRAPSHSKQPYVRTGALRTWTVSFSLFNQIFMDKLNLKNNNQLTESEEESLLRSPASPGEDEAMDVTAIFQDEPMAQESTQGPVESGAAILADVDEGPSVPSNSADQKKFEYFTGAQKRRIKAMIRDGMTIEEARTKERVRYAQVKADQAAYPTSTSSKRCRSNKNSPSDVVPQVKKHKPSGIEKISERSEVAPTVSAPQNKNSPKAAKEEQHGTAKPSYKEMVKACKVAITHTKHPEEKLNTEQIALIRGACYLKWINPKTSITISVLSTAFPGMGGCLLRVTTVKQKFGWKRRLRG